MGYQTILTGKFKFNRELTETEANYINLLSTTRRMKRDVSILMEQYKGEYGNPFAESNTPEAIYGREGEFFAMNDGDFGQRQNRSIMDFNTPPGQVVRSWDIPFLEHQTETNRRIDENLCQPGLWCQWVVSDDRKSLAWDGNEKFYSYVEWLKYLKVNFFDKWGVTLKGTVRWKGEDRGDTGRIKFVDNVINVFEKK